MTLFIPKPLTIVDYTNHQVNFSDDRIGYDFIFLHYTAGTRSEDWLTHTSVPPVSAHRLIKQGGTIYKLLDDKYVAFTQGFGTLGGLTENLNRYSLSIEFESMGNYTEDQLRSGAKQVVEWIGIHDNPSILFHKQVDANKSFCPLAFPRKHFMELVLEELSVYIT